MLECVKCGKQYDPEGWDPLGGDCPIVFDTETGETIKPPEPLVCLCPEIGISMKCSIHWSKK